MFKKLRKKIAIGLTFAMVAGVISPANGGALSKKIYAADEPKDLGNIMIDVSNGEQTLDVSEETEENKRIASFVLAMVIYGEVNYESYTEEGYTYTDIDGDEIYDIYSYSLETSKITYGECDGTKLSGEVVYYKASEKVIKALKSNGDDYYSGIVYKFSEPLGDYAINYPSSGESFSLTTASDMDEREVEDKYLYDSFEEIFGSGGSGAEYLLKKTTENSVGYYYLDFDKDKDVDVIVCFEPYYNVSTYYLSKTCKNKKFKLNTTSGKKKVYSSIEFVMPSATYIFDTSKLTIDFNIKHTNEYRLSYSGEDRVAFRKSIEMTLDANMEYCIKTGLNGVKVLDYGENKYAFLDLDGDGKKDVIINWAFYGEQTVEFVSDTICNKTIELEFPDSVKGFKKIIIKFPATLGYGWGEKVIDLRNDIGLSTYDYEFSNIMSFLSFNASIRKTGNMYDLDGDGTLDITIYGLYDGLVSPSEASNLLGKEYTISYTDEELKSIGYKTFNKVKFIFPDKYTNYIEYDAARGNYSDDYLKALLVAMDSCSNLKNTVDTSTLDSNGNGKIKINYYHTDGSSIEPKGIKDSSTPDLIGYFDVENYRGKDFKISGGIEKTADSYFTGDKVTLNLAWNASLYKGVNLTFKADVKDIVVPEIGKVEIVDGKAIPDIKLTYKDRELVEGEDYTITYENNDKPGVAKAIITGKGLFEGKLEILFEVIDKKTDNPSDEKEVADGPTVGKTVKDKKYIYEVTKAGSTDGKIVGEVKVIGLKNKKLTEIKIATIVKIDKVKYKVTAVGNKAFKKNKKITKAIIGNNVKSIGNSAFEGCAKLKLVNIKSKKLTKIGKKAFAKCKKLKTLVIKSTKLKKIGKGAVKGTSKKLILKAPKNKKASYEEKFKKAGLKK